MAYGRSKLDRFTQFISEDEADIGLPWLVSNHERQWSPPLGNTTTDEQLGKFSALNTYQKSVQTPSVPESTTAKPQARLDIPITSGLLWNKYQLIHRRRLGGKVVVAFESQAEDDHYLIRRMNIAKDEVLSFRKHWLSHKNLCKTHEVFEDDGKFYCVMESAVVTLLHVCRCPEYPDEKQLVAITKQMLAGIAYLSSEGLLHKRLRVGNVVISDEGVVKINKLEYCKQDRDCALKSAKALGRTTTMLMTKSTYKKGDITVRQRHGWSDMAMNFLSATRTWTSDALLKHDFIQQEYKIKALKLHVQLVQATAQMEDDDDKNDGDDDYDEDDDTVKRYVMELES